jgi:hypothetical protein
MSQESNWPVRLWAGAICVALMFGAAGLGGAALNWFERARGSVVAVLDSRAVAVPVEVVEGHHRAHVFRMSSQVCPHGATHCAAPRLSGAREATEF